LKTEWHEEFVTKTWLGDYIYKRCIDNPATLFAIVNVLAKTGIINSKLQQFMESSMADTEKRKRVYRTWKVYQKLNPDLQVIAHYINTKKIRIELFFGKNDKIIRPELASKLTRRLKQKKTVHLLETGHQLLSKADEITSIILRS
jgi:hypothetical protein